MMSDVREVKLCSDLYDILEACTKEEIAPIVDVLVKSPVSVLQIGRAFERHTPDHTRYADQIGDEVYRLALMALGHDKGTRPAYSAMLEGLSKQIGLPIAPGDVSATEANLLNAFASQHLLSVPAATRQFIVSEAAAAASRAASGFLSSDAWAPFASTLLLLVYRRRTLVEDARIPLLPQSQSAIIPAAADDGVDAMVVVRVEGGEPVLSLATIPKDATGWQDLGQNSKVSSLLYPMLEAIQPLIAGGQMLRGDTLWEVAEKGTAHIVQKGYQGMRDLAPVSAAGLMGPIAMMALMSAMVERHKLEQIENGLAEIKATIKDIAMFQKGERRSVLTGSVRYFQQIAQSVLAGELADEVLHGIERHEIELLRVQDHLTEEASEQITALRAIQKEGWGSGKYVSAIQDQLALVDTTYNELFLCIRARACAYMLLCAFPGRETGKRARLNEIRDALDTFSPLGAATIALDQGLRERLLTVPSFETKASLLSKENALLERVSASTASILKGLNSPVHAVLDTTASLSFNVKLRDGRPVAIRMDDPMAGYVIGA
jgi:hypothetical protein